MFLNTKQNKYLFNIFYNTIKYFSKNSKKNGERFDFMNSQKLGQDFYPGSTKKYTTRPFDPN